MHLSKVNECLSHRIVGGSEYLWKCFGYNARFLDYESDFAYASVVFNPMTGEVYQAELSAKNDDQLPYRWIDPMYKQAHVDEGKERDVDPAVAWDGVKWVDLDLAEDWLTKSHTIFNMGQIVSDHK